MYIRSASSPSTVLWAFHTIQPSSFSYCIDNNTLPVVKSVTDLGVTYDTKLKFDLHIDKIYAKASSRAKLLLKCFNTRSAAVLLKAFCTFVRPILEYTSVIWSPYYKRDIEKLESGQRMFTKRMSGLYRKSYCQRLALLQLDSLHVRRVKSDLIMCYKILNNLVHIDVHSFFTLSDYVSTRNNGVKLNKTRCCSVRDANFFCNRIVNIWNALPHYIVQASSITSFKRHLSRFNIAQFCIM